MIKVLDTPVTPQLITQRIEVIFSEIIMSLPLYLSLAFNEGFTKYLRRPLVQWLATMTQATNCAFFIRNF
ncbi:hypothetical protein J6590_047702 [Homalodisca vitripennis]|nr:hypothetical protein J6590_047702 [Homalodisca vitripennis]